jgi:hypothetical protein
MDNKIHIKAICGRNIQVDAKLYGYGEKIDCYLTPAQFKDYVKGFLDFDIIMDNDNSQKSINEENKIEKPKEIVKDDVRKYNTNETISARKGTKKII